LITKNALVLRDIDLLGELARTQAIRVALSVTTLDEKLRRTLEPRTASGERRIEAVARLNAAGIPAGPINFPDEALTDEHVLARQMIVELEHPLIGVVRSIAAPMRFAANGPTYRRYPPRLGEHNAEIRATAATW